jgi:uncharacterized protein
MLQPTVPAWFEIPARDLDRAVRFYETLADTRLQRESMGPLQMAVFPHSEPAPSGALVSGEGFAPAASGTVVYLHLDDIRPAMQRAIAAGGAISTPRTELPGGTGFFARIRDTEGNVVGLFSRV